MSFDPVRDLPQEAALQIFSYLSPADLGKCSQVSHGWRNFVADNSLWQQNDNRLIAKVGSYVEQIEIINNSLWKNVYQNELGRLYTQYNIQGADNLDVYLDQLETMQLFNRKRDYFDVIGKCCFSPIINTQNQLIERIQAFADKISLGQNGRFTVYCCLQNNNLKQDKIISIEIITKGQFVKSTKSEAAIKNDALKKINFICELPENDQINIIDLNDNNEFDHEEVFFSSHIFQEKIDMENIKKPPYRRDIDFRHNIIIQDHDDNYIAVADYLNTNTLQTTLITPILTSQKLRTAINTGILNSKLQTLKPLNKFCFNNIIHTAGSITTGVTAAILFHNGSMISSIANGFFISAASLAWTRLIETKFMDKDI